MLYNETNVDVKRFVSSCLLNSNKVGFIQINYYKHTCITMLKTFMEVPFSDNV